MDNANAVLSADQEKAQDAAFIGQGHVERLDRQYMSLVHDKAQLEAVTELQAKKLADLRAQLDAANARIVTFEAAATPATAPATEAATEAAAPAVSSEPAPATDSASQDASGPDVFRNSRVIESTPN